MHPGGRAALVGGLVAALVAVPNIAWASPIKPHTGVYTGKVGLGHDRSAGTSKVTVRDGAIRGIDIHTTQLLVDKSRSAPGCDFGHRIDTAGYTRSGGVGNDGRFDLAFTRHLTGGGTTRDDVIHVQGRFASATAITGTVWRTVTAVTPPATPEAAPQTRQCVSRHAELHAVTQPALWPFPRGPRAVDCSKRKCVAITFDDGPGSQTTQLLRMLRERHARATWFVLGQMVASNPGALRQIDKAGHEIGNHSWSHELMTSQSDAEVRSQFERTSAIIKHTVGYRPALVRPPYGGINSRVQDDLRRAGYPAILWDVDPLDWRDRNASTVASRVLANVHPGSIVLMHDIHSTTVAAVPRILAELDRQGYTFVTVSELYGHPLQAGRIYTER